MGLLDNLDPMQRKMLLIGAPVVGVAAVYALAKGGTPGEDEEPVDDATGTSGIVTGVIPGGTPGGASTGAIGTGELSSFLENVSDALTVVRSEQSEAIADLRAENEDWRAALEDSITGRFDQERQTPTTPPRAPAPPAEVSTQQRVLDVFAKYNLPTSVTQGPTSETAEQRIARITREVESGSRSLASVEASVRRLAENR